MELPDGANLMEAPVAAGIPGIEGQCGGVLVCATCHVVVEGGCFTPAGPMEDDMLDTVEDARSPNSRLSCQLVFDAELDRLELLVPQVSG